MEERPFYIDETWIEGIEDGAWELTSEAFFDALEESPGYLTTRPFQVMIVAWQDTLHTHVDDDDTEGKRKRNEARDNLLRIGRSLAHEGQGRPPVRGDLGVYTYYRDVVKAVEETIRNDGSGNPLKTFLEAYPSYADCFNMRGGRRHRTPSEIAIRIVTKKRGISERTLRTIIKEWGNTSE